MSGFLFVVCFTTFRDVEKKCSLWRRGTQEGLHTG